MKKYLILLLLFGFISCNNSQTEEKKILSTTNNNTTIIKISHMSYNEISEIYTNYEEAFKTAKIENKALLILFSTEYCRWCTKLKETTLKNPEVIKRLNQEFVVLFLDRDKDEYPSKYNVKAVPAVYFTDKNEEIFTSMVGYHKDPQDFIKWFNYIKIELSQSH
jgi:thioredoxin-related protein